ncbi:MAG: nitrophenyl compound nitroreductase subunit ArsF family protein [archaeon]
MKQFQKLLLYATFMSLLFVFGCTTKSETTTGNTAVNSLAVATTPKVDKIEVYHFHGTNQCYTCKTIKAYAETTVNTYFSNELASGKIVFASINVDEPTNLETTMKYGATGSSLWLGVYDDTGFHAEQNTNVWYKIDNKQAYMDYLKGVIEKRLIGDYS